MKNNHYNRKTEICICHNCGIKFEKPSSEIKRNEKLNRPNFCSRICVGKNNSKNLDLKNFFLFYFQLEKDINKNIFNIFILNFKIFKIKN